MLTGAIAASVGGLVGLALGVVIGRVTARDQGEGTAEVDWRTHPTPAVLCTRSWEVVGCNAACTTWLGYPEEVLVGLRLTQLVGDDERTRVRRRLDAAGGTPRSLRTALRRPDGELLTAELSIADAGQTGYLVALQPQDDATSPRLARLSASVREPLMSILGSSDLLAEGGGSRADAQVAQTIRQSARRLARALDAVTGVGASLQTGPQAMPRRVTARSEGMSWRVMVVEDHDVNAKVLQQLLRRLGVGSVWARNGQEALDLLREEEVDAILMDCHMPVMDGYEAAQRIRSSPRWSTVPIIAVTAHAMDEDRQRSRRAGMDDHVTKPVGLADLRRALTRWLGELGKGGPGVLDEVALQALCELLGDDTAATVELFIADGASSIDGMVHAQAQGELADVARRAHALRSTAGYVGATAVSACCDRLVHAARSGDHAAIEPELQQLGTAFDAACDLLRRRILSQATLPDGRAI